MSVELDYRSNVMPALSAIERFAHQSVNDSNVTGGRVLRDPKGKEIVDNSGGNAVIFKYELADRSMCALRIFKQFPVDDDRVQRLAPISQALARVSSPILVSYRFFNPGLHLANPDEEVDGLGVPFVTPILVMGWVEGVSLGKYVQNLCTAGDTEELARLFENWLILVREMRRIGLTHGDITASNIMVRSSDRALVLVDYDDLFMPGMEDPARLVMGTPGYQHPKQKGGRPYGPRMDDFSLLTVTVSLAVLTEHPEKFRSPDHLFFRKGDLDKTNSDAFELAKSVWDVNAKRYVRALVNACNASPDAPVEFDEIVFDEEITGFRDAISRRDRSMLRKGTALVEHLSVWEHLSADYEDIIGRAKERGIEMLRYAIASGNPDWVREVLNRPVDPTPLPGPLRIKMDEMLKKK